MTRRARSAGLTLIEVLIATTVVALLATLSLPGMASMLNRHRLLAAAEGLVADVTQARERAAHTGQTVHVVFRPGANWCYALARTPGCGCDDGTACLITAVRSTDRQGVQLVAGADTRFDPMAAGTVGAAGLLAELGNGSRQLGVRLSPLGRPYVCSPDGEGGLPVC